MWSQAGGRERETKDEPQGPTRRLTWEGNQSFRRAHWAQVARTAEIASWEYGRLLLAILLLSVTTQKPSE